MANTFVLYDDRLPNADDSRVLLSGLHLERFKKNPVMLYMHNRAIWGEPSGSEVIGRWENIRVKGTQLLAEAVFDEKDEVAAKLARKVSEGFLRGASIGIDVHRTSDEEKDRLPGQRGRTITKSTLLEASVVDIPQSEGALKTNYAALSYGTNFETFNHKQKVDMDTNAYEQELKQLRKGLLKALSLESASDDALADAVAELQEKHKALSAALQAEREATDSREIEAALSVGAIEKDEVARYTKLFATSREVAQEMLQVATQKHAATQKETQERKQTVAEAVRGSTATGSGDAPERPIDEQELKQLAAELKDKPEELAKLYQSNLRKYEQLNTQ